MELRGRLSAIAEKIPQCGTLADIGTDHAYIPVFALLHSKCRRAVAADVKKGPVEIAVRNIRHYELENSIETRLGYGLQPLLEGEADVIVITGMGGMLITEILTDGLEKACKAGLLILQPMNAVEALREWLYETGFDIIEETLAEETDKIYNILCVKWTGLIKKLDKFHYYIGYELEGRTDRLFKKYAAKRLKLLETMINGMKMAEKGAEGLDGLIETRDRLEELIKKI